MGEREVGRRRGWDGGGLIEGFDAVRPALGRDDDHKLVLMLGGAFLPSQLQGGQRKTREGEGGKTKSPTGPVADADLDDHITWPRD